MAQSQAKPEEAAPEADPSLRLLHNPLKLRQPKTPIVNAKGHVFDGDLMCSHCGKAWYDQRLEPTPCGPDSDEVEAEAQASAEDEWRKPGGER